MKLISYWIDSGNAPTEIHTDDGMVLIVGYYNHKNKHARGEKALGVHWGDYPQSRGVLSPCVIPASTRSAILSGLLHQAVLSKKQEQIMRITEALAFFNT